jgi:hypothetical protein
LSQRCIYRNVTLNHNEPPDGDTASVEHIIPWAIGGANGLVTADVSKLANNDLGSSVDAPFADTLPIAIKRHQLQLKSQKGNVTPIVWSGESPEGIRGTMTIHADGKVDVTFDLKVDRPAPGAPGPITVSGPRERIEPVLKGMLAGMKKRSQTIYSKDGKLLTSLDNLFSASEQFLIDELNLKIEYFNQEAWTRGILKIVLAAGHKLLGYGWTFGQTANLIREFVLKPRKDWPSEPLRGYIAGEWDRDIRLALGKSAQVHDQLIHTVAILPYDPSGEAVALISLFGGNGVPEALVRIGKLPQAMIDALNDQRHPEVVLGYHANPTTRQSESILFSEIDRRIAKHGPTNRKSLAMYHKIAVR